MMGKGEATRNRVIVQAAPVFNQRGFAGTTVSELMDATGLKKGGIYRHFAGKEELALAAFDHAFAVSSRLRFDDIDSKASAVDRLKQFVSNFARRRSPIPGGCPVWNTAADCDDGNPTLRERAGPHFDPGSGDSPTLQGKGRRAERSPPMSIRPSSQS